MTLPSPLLPLAYPPGYREAGLRNPRSGGSDLPRLSVVTPSFNQGGFLESTIRSVLAEHYPNLEYIVVDGGSQDRSLEVIRHYAEYLTSWVSEPDGGQVDAILKGLRRATGEWFLWLNSDDVLAAGTLWKVAATAARDVDLIAGVTREFDARGLRRPRRCRRLDVPSLLLEQMPSGVRWHQPGMWMRRAALARTGIDEGLHYRFDYDMLTRYLLDHPRVSYLPDTLAYFRLHGGSKTVSLGPRFRDEHLLILERWRSDPAFAAFRAQIDLGHRAVAWLKWLDGVSAAVDEPRWPRLRAIVAGVRQDPDARWTRNTRRIMRRIALRGGRRGRS